MARHIKSGVIIRICVRVSNYRKLVWSFTHRQKIVTDKHLLKDLDCVSKFHHIANLEVYHSLLNKYCAKILSFSYADKYARIQHPLLDHSCDVRESRVKLLLVYWKVSASWIIKTILVNENRNWFKKIIERI